MRRSFIFFCLYFEKMRSLGDLGIWVLDCGMVVFAEELDWCSWLRWETRVCCVIYQIVFNRGLGLGVKFTHSGIFRRGMRLD
jgi:hypothetical protein